MDTQVDVVIGLVARCAFDVAANAKRRRRKGVLHFGVAEFALLGDGRRLVLRSDRGFSAGFGRRAPDDVFWSQATVAGFERDVRNTLLPDEPIHGEIPTPERHWAFAVEALANAGIVITAEELSQLPMTIEFDDSITTRLAPNPHPSPPR